MKKKEQKFQYEYASELFKWFSTRNFGHKVMKNKTKYTRKAKHKDSFYSSFLFYGENYA